MQWLMTHPDRSTMTRAQLMKQLAQIATRPLVEDMHQPVLEAPRAPVAERDLYVWFEDT